MKKVFDLEFGEMWKCPKCKNVLPREDFYDDGTHTYCKDCQSKLYAEKKERQ